MYCGKYAALQGGNEEEDIYIAYNMYWKPQQFGIPTARNGKKWEVAFSTNTIVDKEKKDIGKMYLVPGRSITVLVAK